MWSPCVLHTLSKNKLKQKTKYFDEKQQKFCLPREKIFFPLIINRKSIENFTEGEKKTITFLAD